MIIRGASTPPEVPDPSAIAQISPLVHEPRQEARSEAGDQPERERAEQRERSERQVPAGREHRSRAHQRHAQRARDGRGGSHRDEAAGLPFEQQQLDGQQHRRHGRRKDRRHAARGARHEQRLALGGGHVKPLREQRAECAARHDDRTFRTERPARPDRQR